MTKAQLLVKLAAYPDDAEVRIRTNRVYSLPLHFVDYGPEGENGWMNFPPSHKWRGEGEFISLDCGQFLAIME